MDLHSLLYSINLFTMKPLELPIFHHSDQTASLMDLDIDFDIKDCTVKAMTFYSINAIGIDHQDGKDYGLIFSNGDSFTSPLSYAELKNKISKNLTTPYPIYIQKRNHG